MPEFAQGFFDSIPIRLYWAGWESNTLSLKRMGWELFAEEQADVNSFCHIYRIAAKGPDNKLVISGQLNVSAEAIFCGGSRMQEVIYQGLEMQTYRATDQVFYHQMNWREADSWNSLKPFDGYAQIPMGPEPKYFSDFKLFNFINTTAPNEIYIPSDSIDDYLNRILQLQYPKQQEIKKGLILPDAKPIVQAKIYSLAA